MDMKNRLKGAQRKKEKQEQHRAKLEGRDVRPDFPPLLLIGFLVVGSFLALMFPPLVILVITFPLVRKDTMVWDFRMCIKLALMISIVVAISLLAVLEPSLTELGSNFLYNLATISLILYTGVYLVRMLQGTKR